MYKWNRKFLTLSDDERTLQVVQSRVVVASRNVTKLVALRFNMFEGLVVSFAFLDFLIVLFVGRLSKAEESFSG